MRIEKNTFEPSSPPPRPLTENLKGRELPTNEALEQARKRAELNFADRLRERSSQINPTENLGQGARNGQENTSENEAKRLAQIEKINERIRKLSLKG